MTIKSEIKELSIRIDEACNTYKKSITKLKKIVNSKTCIIIYSHYEGISVDSRLDDYDEDDFIEWMYKNEIVNIIRNHRIYSLKNSYNIGAWEPNNITYIEFNDMAGSTAFRLKWMSHAASKEE